MLAKGHCSSSFFTGLRNINISLGCQSPLFNQMGRPSSRFCNILESICLLHHFHCQTSNILFEFSFFTGLRSVNISLGCQSTLSNQIGRPSSLSCNSLQLISLLHHFHCQTSNVLLDVSSLFKGFMCNHQNLTGLRINAHQI